MSNGAPANPNPNSNFDPFVESIKHAESGYKNAQDIIKFVDAKAGAIAAFAFVGIGIVLQGMKEFLGFTREIQNSIIEIFQAHQTLGNLIIWLFVISTAIGILCVFFVMLCVTARPPQIVSQLKHTILFPHFDEDAEYGFARSHFEKLESGLSHKEVAEEYGTQLLNVGAILHKKLRFLRCAAKAFIWQLLVLTLAGFTLFGTSYRFIHLHHDLPGSNFSGSISNIPSLQHAHEPNNPNPPSNH